MSGDILACEGRGVAFSSFSAEMSTRTVEVRHSGDWWAATSAAASPDCGKVVRSAFEVVALAVVQAWSGRSETLSGRPGACRRAWMPFRIQVQSQNQHQFVVVWPGQLSLSETYVETMQWAALFMGRMGVLQCKKSFRLMFIMHYNTFF